MIGNPAFTAYVGAGGNATDYWQLPVNGFAAYPAYTPADAGMGLWLSNSDTPSGILTGLETQVTPFESFIVGLKDSGATGARMQSSTVLPFNTIGNGAMLSVDRVGTATANYLNGVEQSVITGDEAITPVSNATVTLLKRPTTGALFKALLISGSMGVPGTQDARDRQAAVSAAFAAFFATVGS
jgi:hypothetical protein